MKKKCLVIAEKPSVCQEYRRIYSKLPANYEYDLDFVSARGHLVGLLEPDEYKAEWGKPWKLDVIPMIPESFKTKVIVEDVFNDIKEKFDNNSYDYVVNGCDSGNEGFLIFHLIMDQLNCNLPVLRLWADDTSEKTLIKAFNNLIPNERFANHIKSAYLRLYADWLMGLNFSRCVTLNAGRTSVLGRVMTAVLGLVVSREKLIKNFVPDDYYEISAKFQKNVVSSGVDVCTAKLINTSPHLENNQYGFKSSNKAKEIFNSIKDNKTAYVSEIVSEDKITNAPTLFNLSDLQKYCSSNFGLTPDETMNIAQDLYEAKLISYPRTESKCLSNAQREDVKEIISNIAQSDLNQLFTSYAENILNDTENFNAALKSKKYFDDNKVSDHPALTPVSRYDNTKISLSEEHLYVYCAIVSRFLSIFLPPERYTTSVVTFNCGSQNFRCAGYTITDPGWTVFVGKERNSVILPNFSLHEEVLVSNMSLDKKQTTVPMRYNDATLLTAMETAGRTLDDEELEKVLLENNGLGTAATRSEIIKKLFRLNYITKQDSKGKETKSIRPTVLGSELIEMLGDNPIVSPVLTALWGKKFKEVKDNKLDYDTLLAEIKQFVIDTCDTFNKTIKNVGPLIDDVGLCPVCKKYKMSYTPGFTVCMGNLKKDASGNKECHFSFKNIFGTNNLTRNDIVSLLKDGCTREQNFKTLDGNIKFTRLMFDDNEDGRKIIRFARLEDRDAICKCPFCKTGDIYESSKCYYCSNGVGEDANCNFIIKKKFGKTAISKKVLKEILEKGATSNVHTVTFPNDKKYSGIFVLSYSEKYGYGYDIGKFEEKVICKCPKCDNNIVETQYAYECETYKLENCDFKLNKKYLGATFTANDIKLLVDKKSVKKKIQFNDAPSPVEKNIVLELIDGKYRYRYTNIPKLSLENDSSKNSLSRSSNYSQKKNIKGNLLVNYIPNK